jgi:hypothetical protein
MIPYTIQNIPIDTIRIIKSTILLLLVLTLVLSARQHQTLLKGIVLNNATKERIIGANVLIIGSTFGASTDTIGKFSISYLPPGSYEVRVSAVGFLPVIIRGVAIATSHPVEITVPLTEQLVQMSEVVTLGGQFLNLKELNVSTRYLDYREIQHTAGAFDDVLRTITILPGVAQTRIDRNDLSVRGGAPSENLQIIDGIEIDNINHFATQGSGGGTNTFLNLDFVENSFFSGGGFGVRFGDKLSSVLAITMREGRRDNNRGKATISATQVGLNLDGPLSQNGSYLFSVRRSYLDFVFKMYDYPYTPSFWDFLGKMSYHISREDEIEFLGIGVIDRIHRFDETPQQIADNNRKILGDLTKAIGGITWHHGFNCGLLTLSGWHSYSEYRYEQVGDRHNPHLYNSSYEGETSLKIDGIVQVFSSTEVSAGLGFKTARLYSKIQTTVIATGYTQDVRILPIDLVGDTSGYKFSGYTQVSQTLGDIVLTGGIRADFFSMIYEKFVLAPRFSVSVQILPTTRMNASIGRYEQSPSYIWLLANPYNRALTHMGMNQYVLGVEHYLHEDLSLNLEGYLKRYDHYPISLTRPYIVMVNTGGEIEEIAEAYASLGLDFLESSGTGESRGLELFIQKKVSDSPLYGRISLNYSETTFKALDGVSRPSSYDQRWRFSVSGGYAFDENWEFNAAFHLATGRPYTPFTQLTFQRSRDDYNTARVGTNHGLDVRVSRRWVTGKIVINTFIDIQNLYNRKPEEPPQWNQDGRYVEVTPTLGIVPSIGVSVEF